ncbi:MAG: hypothetical protein F6K41_03460 [Symploca sp. SIO3E6]|nr:hypothetical protein [Caldora sp. SIO3E6]
MPKVMKNFWRNLPQSAKMFLILFLLGLSIIGALDLGQFAVNRPEKASPTTEYYEVRFIILSKVDNEPINKAEVQFIFDGAPEPRFTNDDGYVGIDIPKRNDIDVVIKRKGFKDLSRRINLEVDPDRTIIYYLEPNEKELSYNLNTNYKEGDLIKSTITEHTQSRWGDKKDYTSLNETRTLQTEVLILEIEGAEPSKFIEKTLLDQTLLSSELVGQYQNVYRTYNYNFAEKGIFDSTSILCEKQKGVWSRKLINVTPNTEQAKELNRSWNWADDYQYSYPNYRVKLGDSWDVFRYGGGLLENIALKNSSLQARLIEITEYEGEKSAKVAVKGTFELGTFIPNYDIYQTKIKLINKTFTAFFKDLAFDIFLDTIADSIHNGDFQFILSLKERSEQLYKKVADIYSIVHKNPQKLTLAEIRKKVANSVIPSDFWGSDEKLLESLESEAASYFQDLQDQGHFAEGKFDVEGEVYRSLDTPIDLYSKTYFSSTIRSADEISDGVITEFTLTQRAYINRRE